MEIGKRPKCESDVEVIEHSLQFWGGIDCRPIGIKFSEGIYTANMTYSEEKLISERNIIVRIGNNEIVIETKDGVWVGKKKQYSYYFDDLSSLHYDDVINGFIGWWTLKGYEGFWKITDLKLKA